MTIINFAKLRDQLTVEEGKRYKLYADSKGVPSIGIGRNLRDVGVSDDEIALMFFNDIYRVGDELSKNLPWVSDLDEVRLRVFYDLCFNMGIGGLLQFHHMLSAAKAGDFNTAADELNHSIVYTEH